MEKLDIIITGNDDIINEKVSPTISKKLFGKSIPLYKQLESLLLSLRENWEGEYELYFLHSLPIGPKYKQLLNKYSVTILNKKHSSYPLGIEYNRITAYKYAGLNSTHSLILDYDIICLNTPKLDFSTDFQAMYAGNNEILNWKHIYKICEINYPYLELSIQPFNDYHLNDKTNILPYFNNGVIFIKNSFAKAIYKNIEEVVEKMSKQKHPMNYFDFQIAISVVLPNMTDNWKLLPKGCNFLRPYKWDGEISLYHYLGKKSGVNDNLIKEYFI